MSHFLSFHCVLPSELIWSPFHWTQALMSCNKVMLIRPNAVKALPCWSIHDNWELCDFKVFWKTKTDLRHWSSELFSYHRDIFSLENSFFRATFVVFLVAFYFLFVAVTLTALALGLLFIIFPVAFDFPFAFTALALAFFFTFTVVSAVLALAFLVDCSLIRSDRPISTMCSSHDCISFL